MVQKLHAVHSHYFAKTLGRRKRAAGVAELETYVRNNQEAVPNYCARYRQGETSSTAFVESTINQVVSRRLVKRQQMHWTLRGRTCCCRPEPGSCIRNWKQHFGAGIHRSESKRKPRAPRGSCCSHIHHPEGRRFHPSGAPNRQHAQERKRTCGSREK